jgi:hypothetical protein
MPPERLERSTSTLVTMITGHGGPSVCSEFCVSGPGIG